MRSHMRSRFCLQNGTLAAVCTPGLLVGADLLAAAGRWSRFLKLSDKDDVGAMATRPFSVKNQLQGGAFKDNAFKPGWK